MPSGQDPLRLCINGRLDSDRYRSGPPHKHANGMDLRLVRLSRLLFERPPRSLQIIEENGALKPNCAANALEIASHRFQSDSDGDYG